jgi:hypothetical protein
MYGGGFPVRFNRKQISLLGLIMMVFVLVQPYCRHALQYVSFEYAPEEEGFTVVSEISVPEHLPSSAISIMVSGGLLGSYINATLSFHFIFDDFLSLGFEQEYLEIRDGLFSSPVLGLGYDEMREYPYFYTERGELFDYRKKPAPSWASRRFYAAWTEGAKAGYYLGPISDENISRATLAGDVVEFENLTVYYADSSSRRVGPQLITVGVEFSHDEGDWSIEHTVNASDEVGVTIQTQQIHVPLQHFEPVGKISIVALVAMGLFGLGLYVRRKKSIGKEDRPSIDVAE